MFLAYNPMTFSVTQTITEIPIPTARMIKMTSQ